MLTKEDICIFDIETDGLDDATRVHVVTVKVLDGESRTFIDSESSLFDSSKYYPLASLGEYFDKFKMFSCHNMIGFDLEKLKVLLGIDLYDRVLVDTLVLSRMYMPDMPLPTGCPTSILNPITGHKERVAPHSIAAWGHRIGYSKIEHHEWDTLSENMIERNVVDVIIQEKVLKALIRRTGIRLSDFFKYYTLPFADVISELRPREPAISWLLPFILETKVECIIQEQIRNGIAFNTDKAHRVLQYIEEQKGLLEKELFKHFDLIVRPYGQPITKPYYARTGALQQKVVDWYAEELQQHPTKFSIGGPFTRVVFTSINLNSSKQVSEQLLARGWQPSSYTEKGTPQLVVKGVPCQNIALIDDKLGPTLSKYLTLLDRDATIKGYLKLIRADNRVSARAISCGTNTARMTHSGVVNVPAASPTVFLGYEMRDLFECSHGTLLCGHDAAGLEARVMGHFTYPIDGGKFAKILLTGDIHSENTKEMFAVEIQGTEKGDPLFDTYRRYAKNLFYALIYGAQKQKLQSMIKGCSKKRAAELFRIFWERNPALHTLKEQAVREHESHGYVTGLDGRQIWTRSPHSALNARFQSTGAIIMKAALILHKEFLLREHLAYKKVIDMHDEGQGEVPVTDVTIRTIHDQKEYIDEVTANPTQIYSALQHSMQNASQAYYTYSRQGELAVMSIRESGRAFGLHIDLDGEYKIGSSWAETH